MMPEAAHHRTNHDRANSGPADANGRGALTYALVTAAYNEEADIQKTLESVTSQTFLPLRWVIVSDGSTDRTDEIVQSYASKYSYIRLLRVERSPGRSFGAKASALTRGMMLLQDLNPDFIGNLDGDISLAPPYFMDLIQRFEENRALGLAGGFVYEERDGKFQSRRSNSVDSVAHAAQLVRRDCFEAIGGYARLEHGGEDWYAQTLAKMKGWHTEAFPDLKIFHHRPTGTGGSLLRHVFRQGRMDYAFGSYPAFEVVKCLKRVLDKPFLIGGCTRLAGFAWSYLRGDLRPVSSEFVEFLRKEQKERMVHAFRGRPAGQLLERH